MSSGAVVAKGMDPNMMRLQIQQGAASVRTVLSVEVVNDLLGRVLRANPRDPEGYSYHVGRNAAISMERKRIYAAKLESKRLSRRMAERRDELRLLRAIMELESIKDQFSNPHYHLCLRLRLMGWSPVEIRDTFGVSQDTEYQWKRRGLKVALELGSRNLRSVVKWHFGKMQAVAKRL